VKKVILINFFIVISIILLLEIIIRFLNIVGLQGYDKNIFYQENNITFSKPNKTFKVFGKNSRTDGDGFRIPLKNFSYDTNKNFYLILGDSVAYGVGVKEKDSFIGILREKKNNLLNTAISGHNLESYLYILEKSNSKFKNKINKVIIFLCLNDASSHQGVIPKEELNKSKNKKNLFEDYIKNDLILKMNVFLREKSYLFVLIKGLFTNPIKRHYDYMNILYESEENLIKFKKNIKKIHEFSASNNLKLEFVLLPYTYQILKNCDKQFLNPQNEISKIFTSLGLKINNYTNDFCKKSNNKKLFLPYDPVHLSKYGHKYVSKLLIKDKIID